MNHMKSVHTGSFSSSVANPSVHGKNVLYLRKGSTCIGTRWVHFLDQTLPIDDLVQSHILTNRKLFRGPGDVKYLLVVMDQDGVIDILNSVEEQISDDAEIKVFEDLSNVAPLVLVKVTQDGTSGLTGIRELTENDLEVYNGYGNFTTRGEPGPLGVQGPTGMVGETGPKGEQGLIGVVGPRGATGAGGATGANVPGTTGALGHPGNC